MDINDLVGKFPVTPVTDWAAERKFFGRFYQSQGFGSKKEINNDCGPASLAVVLNLFLFQASPGTPLLAKETILHSSQFHFWDRLPGWVPRVGGATSPWGLAAAFNRWSRQYQLNWQAQRKSHARKAHVLESLLMGRPVSALKIWNTGGAHWVTLVRYASEKERLYFLDPNPYLEYLPEGKRLQSQSWDAFMEDWSRSVWWSKLLGIKQELIVYTNKS
jgi:hypothetical protein